MFARSAPMRKLKVQAAALVGALAPSELPISRALVLQ